MESIIKWQTGTPKEPGKYLISDKHYNVDSDWWTRKEGCELVCIEPFEKRFFDDDIVYSYTKKIYKATFKREII